MTIEPNWPKDRIVAHIRELPIWQARPAIEPLVGGLQNPAFIVTDGEKKYVARVGFDLPHLGTLQSSVVTSMRAAAELGVSPALRYAEGCLTVIDFIDGRSFTEEDIHERETLSRIVAVLKRLHAGAKAVRDPVNFFWPFVAVRNLAHYGLETESPHKSTIPPLLEIIDRLERAVAPFTPVFAHNDLAHVNMMADRNGRIWFIDWDYGAFGHPLWDVAEMLGYALSDDELDRDAIELYLGGLSEREMARRLHEHRAFQLMSYLRQYFFCILQEQKGSRRADDVEESMGVVFPGEEDASYSGFRKIAKERFDRLWARHGENYMAG